MESSGEPSIIRYWARLVIGVILGLFIGTEVMVFAKTWIINPLTIIPLLLLYIFIFSLIDDLIVRFDLNDRDLLVVGAILAFIIGGVSNQEMYASKPEEFAILGLNPYSVILDTIGWGISIVLWFHTMKWVYPRKGKSSLITWKGWTGVIAIFLFLALTYFNNRAIPERRLSDFLLFVIAVLFALLLIFILQKRKGVLQNIENRNKLVIALGTSFVPVSIVVVLLGIEFIFPLPLHIFLYFLFYIPLIIFIMLRKRLAV